MRVDEITQQWPPRLNGREIAAYIESIAVGYVDREMIEEYLGRDAEAVLKMVPIGALKPGSEYAHIRVPSREKRYMRMKPETMPAMVVWEDGEIIDGNHRYRVARAQGVRELLCYVVGL